jgi:hypothetical protein
VISLTPIDDGGTGGTSPTGGSGGGPAIVDPRWVDIHWVFPTAFESQIIGFDVVAYSGSDVTDASTYLFIPVRVDPSVRRCIKSFPPKAALATVNAAVRAVYA